MMESWYGMGLLALESSGVVCLRLMQLAGGGEAARHESELMVREKFTANMEAAMTLMTGGSLDSVVGRYREQVAANTDRLMRTMFAAHGGCAAPAGR